MKQRAMRATTPAGAAISTGKGKSPDPGESLASVVTDDCLIWVKALLVVTISIEVDSDTVVVMGIVLGDIEKEDKEDVD